MKKCSKNLSSKTVGTVLKVNCPNCKDYNDCFLPFKYKKIRVKPAPKTDNVLPFKQKKELEAAPIKENNYFSIIPDEIILKIAASDNLNKRSIQIFLVLISRAIKTKKKKKDKTNFGKAFITQDELAQTCGFKAGSNFKGRYIDPLVNEGLIQYDFQQMKDKKGWCTKYTFTIVHMKTEKFNDNLEMGKNLSNRKKSL